METKNMNHNCRIRGSVEVRVSNLTVGDVFVIPQTGEVCVLNERHWSVMTVLLIGSKEQPDMEDSPWSLGAKVFNNLA